MKTTPTIRFEDIDWPPDSQDDDPQGGDDHHYDDPQGDDDPQYDYPPGGDWDEDRYVNVLRVKPTAPPPVDRTNKPQPPAVDRNLKPPGVPLTSLIESSSSDGDMPCTSAKTVAYTLVTFKPSPQHQPAPPRGGVRPKLSNYTEVDLAATQAMAAKVSRQASAPVCPSRPMVAPRAAFREEFENDDDDGGGGGGGGGGDGDIVNGCKSCEGLFEGRIGSCEGTCNGGAYLF